MPIGPLGEIIGTTGTLDTLSEKAKNYKSKVIAPRNPKLVKAGEDEFKVLFNNIQNSFVFILICNNENR